MKVPPLKTPLASAFTTAALIWLVLFVSGVQMAQAQYPKISDEVQAEINANNATENARVKAAWEKALPAIEEGEKQGKPYIPSAGQPHELPSAKIPSFPGAQGGGMYSFGGRGGKVMVVTNLNDDGPGSFREALEAGGPRIVVFNVAGVIQLKSRIRVRAPYATIVGSSAPGDGVCIAGATVELEAHDFVIRDMRFRRGQTWVGDRNDSIGGNPVGNVMIDHVSASWGLDENMSMYRHMYQPPDGSKELKLPTVNITIQNSIFAEGLNTFHHAFGSTIGGLNSTFLHNVWASNTGRNPSVGMYGDFTFVNNVLFNWVHRTIDGGDHHSYFNIINNYYKPGPATPEGDIRHRLLKPESERSKTVVNHYGKAYVDGNIVDGDEVVTKDNWNGGVQIALETPEDKLKDLMKTAPTDPAKLAEFTADAKAKVAALTFVTTTVAEALQKIRVDKPFPHAPFAIMSAQDAYEYNLANAGATLPKRDPVDTRILEFVRDGKPTAKVFPETRKQLVQKPYTDAAIDELIELIGKGIITNPEQVGGYPEYKGTPYKDSDSDGMPDDWEIANGLNPKDASDSSGDLNGDGYTNIEKFLYGLDPKAPKMNWNDPKNNVDKRDKVPASSSK